MVENCAWKTRVHVLLLAVATILAVSEAFGTHHRVRSIAPVDRPLGYAFHACNAFKRPALLTIATHHAAETFSTSMLRMSQEQADNTPEPVSKEKLASMIEKSFVEGVMQLAQGYVETIKLFIAAVLTGYGMSLPLKELLEMVRACPGQSANRPLMTEEEDLRSTWIKLIYVIAQSEEYRSTVVQDAHLLIDKDLIDGDDGTWNAYKSLLPRLREMHDQGNEIGPRFRAEEILVENASLLSPLSQDPFQKAILLQNLRIMWITLTVLEEEKLCLAEQEPPAPPIPNKQLGSE